MPAPSANPVPAEDRDEFDALTGTLTRQRFLRRMADAAEVAMDAVVPFSLCIADVDQFRSVNDRHGQRIGDEVLLGVTRRLRKTLAAAAHHPNGYLLGRYDGNSLAVLIQKTGLERASAIAEHLRCGVARDTYANRLRATVSVGVAQYRIGEAIDSTLARAEQALYLAKQSGRDRVEVVESPAVKASRGEAVVPWDRTLTPS